MPTENTAASSPILGGGQIGQRVRETDWSATPLGDYATWPQSLRSSLSLVLNAKGIAALYWGPEQWVLYNDAYGVALGERHPWAFGRPMAEALTDIAPVLGPQVQTVLQTGEGFAVENVPLVMRRHGRDEETVWTYSFSPVQGETGGFTGVLLLATEMTQQKAAERSEDRIRTRLETTLRVAQLGTFDWQPSTGIIEVDARGREMFGLPAGGELRQENTFACIAREDVDRVSDDASRAMGIGYPFDPAKLGQTVDLNYDVIHADGSRRSILSSGIILENPDGTRRMIGAFNDVTELKRAEARLREQNATLEEQVAERTADRNALWQLSSDVMLRCTFDGVITAVNPAWTQMLGWREDELVGSGLFALIHPDDFQHTITGARELADGISHARFDNRYRHRDGSYRWISWSTRPADGLINAVGRDVTIEKEQAEALIQAEAALRQSQKMEAVGQLTGGIAHDFNNLLAVITGSLELLARRVAQGRMAETGRFVDAAQAAAKRATALTHRLLAFSRRQTLDPKSANLNHLVAGLDEMIRRTVGPAITVETVGAGGLWNTQVDPHQLENALLNLCINARDAMPDGGRLTIETANCRLDERAARDRELPPGQYVSLCVSDNGCGMAADVIAKAFEPFFTTKPLGQGTGLGLSMIYGFARQSGGQVRIYSEVDQGTTICVYLPRHYGEEDRTTDARFAHPEHAEAGETVLIVDDEPGVRMLVSEVLGELGYRIIEAEDGPTALNVVTTKTRIDLLVTDVGLPGGMNGRQVADAARALRPDLKVLFITGYAESAAIGNGHLDPGMAVITKPFAVNDLGNRINELISSSMQ